VKNPKARHQSDWFKAENPLFNMPKVNARSTGQPTGWQSENTQIVGQESSELSRLHAVEVFHIPDLEMVPATN
jgi:hypothetical protein